MYDDNDEEDMTRQDVLMYTSIPEIKAYKRHPRLWMDIADLAACLSSDKGLGPRLRRLCARTAEDLEDISTMLSGQTPEEWDEWCRLEALKEEVMAAKAALKNEITAAKAVKKKPKTIAAGKSVLKTLSKSPIKKRASTPAIKKKPKQTPAAISKAKKPTRRKPSTNKRTKKQWR